MMTKYCYAYRDDYWSGGYYKVGLIFGRLSLSAKWQIWKPTTIWSKDA